MSKLLPLFLLSILFSCNSTVDYTSIVPKEVDDYAKDFIKDIQAFKIEESLSKVDKKMQTKEGIAFISNVASGISTFQLDSLNMISARYTSFMGDNPSKNYIIEYEQELKGQSIYFFFSILSEQDKLTITGFDARQMEAPLREIHAFKFTGKPFINYIFFILVLASVGFVLFTLVAVIRTPMKRKWLWIIGVLIAVIKFKLNWTTSEFDFQLINIQLLGAGISKQGIIAPWILSFSIPVFAIIFWVKKIRDKKEIQNEFGNS